MIRLRVRCWMKGTMYQGSMATIMAAEQAAHDYGLPETNDVTPIDWRASGAVFSMWTGEMDAASTEMFEGDVVEVPGRGYWLVRWEKMGYVFTQWKGVNRYDIQFQKDEGWQVVGNICEHPDFKQKVGLP